MKLYLRTEKGIRFYFIVPLWMAKAGVGLGLKIAKHQSREKRGIDLSSVDVQLLKKGINLLKEYRGLSLVDIKSSDGTEVKIIL